MFSPTELEGTEFRLKPMNCPFHIGIYKSAQHSYRDLPLRYAELGTCYRAELSGTLHGLMRVRGFTQDDAHIFCTPETVRSEIVSCIQFAFALLGAFGFDEFKIELSVRGSDSTKKYLGSDENWARGEQALVEALNEQNLPYERMEDEAAFYGPKIDIKVKDSIGRLWQLTTVQFDFNFPQRFQIEYMDKENKPHQPIMIHRALFGSMERFFGVLIEHYAGAFPVWLSPVQVALIPISERHLEYAQKVADQLKAIGIRVEVDGRNEKMNAKIREHAMQKVPFLLVVGDKEAEAGKVNVRTRGKEKTEDMAATEFVEKIKEVIAEKSAIAIL